MGTLSFPSPSLIIVRFDGLASTWSRYTPGEYPTHDPLRSGMRFGNAWMCGEKKPNLQSTNQIYNLQSNWESSHNVRRIPIVIIYYPGYRRKNKKLLLGGSQMLAAPSLQLAVLQHPAVAPGVLLSSSWARPWGRNLARSHTKLEGWRSWVMKNPWKHMETNRP